MKRKWSTKKFTLIYAGVLLAFTTYAALDTFVIPHRYAQAGTGTNAEAAKTNDTTSGTEDETDHATDADEVQGDEAMDEDTPAQPVWYSTVTYTGQEIGSYEDEEQRITLYEYIENDTHIYVADVLLRDADSLRTAFAEGIYGRNIKAETSVIAAENDAVLAINGDFYGSRNAGYVIRDGILYRDTPAGNQEDLAIYADGSWEIVNERDVTAQAMLDAGVKELFSFGPALVVDGDVSVTRDEEVGKAMASNPRTAIGAYSDALHYVFVVSDGRTGASEGLSLYELAEFMQSLGVTYAYNLDGGGSSTMVFNGEVINHPTTRGNHISERSVSDIIFIGGAS